ncbi:hypothetical protein [Pseudotabrizicola alkalilacus]|uniref:Type II secretion system protein n=1 Tax=Pseudotabrizicola alkalilacus TaxID=2305252 RepID=A0A411YYS0_9RHOB|nr:hypothetical protein [Pseudotabrizicola alkalilacus]RGP35903.1 hypothetical protein D1012_17735 [Pseudotabrizicola alkalilacus]
MLEALVAFGLVAFVLGFALPIVSGAAAQQARRLQDLNAAEFAVSLAEAYRATFPQMEAEGQDPAGWAWRITERSVAPDGQTSLDPVMRLVEVQITVWHIDRRAEPTTFSTLIARPRS